MVIGKGWYRSGRVPDVRAPGPADALALTRSRFRAPILHQATEGDSADTVQDVARLFLPAHEQGLSRRERVENGGTNVYLGHSATELFISLIWGKGVRELLEMAVLQGPIDPR